MVRGPTHRTKPEGLLSRHWTMAKLLNSADFASVDFAMEAWIIGRG